jgi:hypothetical protein
MAGSILYFIGCVGLFTNWKTHQKVDTESDITSGLGLFAIYIYI